MCLFYEIISSLNNQRIIYFINLYHLMNIAVISKFYDGYIMWLYILVSLDFEFLNIVIAINLCFFGICVTECLAHST